MIPIIEGLWKVKVSYKTPFEDKATCMEHSLTSTLIIPIGEKRAAPHEHEHHHHH